MCGRLHDSTGPVQAHLHALPAQQLWSRDTDQQTSRAKAGGHYAVLLAASALGTTGITKGIPEVGDRDAVNEDEDMEIEADVDVSYPTAWRLATGGTNISSAGEKQDTRSNPGSARHLCNVECGGCQQHHDVQGDFQERDG